MRATPTQSATRSSSPGASGADKTIRNHVLIEETFDSADYAWQVFTSEATHNAMTNDGIDLATLTLEYLDEAS